MRFNPLTVFVLVSGLMMSDILHGQNNELDGMDVNEGELEFLSRLSDKTIPTVHTELTLRPSSLKDGWLVFRQCQRDLDAVPSLQVDYRYRHIRGLRLESHSNVDRIWVEGQSIQLRGLHRQAGFCVGAQVKLLQGLPDGSYSLRNGPFYRGFLDGYYPLHVILEVHQIPSMLELGSIFPQTQPGLALTTSAGEMRVEAWFRGRLTLECHFVPIFNRQKR